MSAYSEAEAWADAHGLTDYTIVICDDPHPRPAHIDTLTIQDHLRNGHTAIAAQMCEDVALAEFNLPPGTPLVANLDDFTYAVARIDRKAVPYFLGSLSHRAQGVAVVSAISKRRRWFR